MLRDLRHCNNLCRNQNVNILIIYLICKTLINIAQKIREIKAQNYNVKILKKKKKKGIVLNDCVVEHTHTQFC